MIFIYNRFGSVLFGSVRLEYLSFGIRYFGILPDSVVHCTVVGILILLSSKLHVVVCYISIMYILIVDILTSIIRCCMRN